MTITGCLSSKGNVLKIAGTIDYGTQTSFSIRVLSQDRYGLTVERVITLTLSLSGASGASLVM
jgi:hypothetical protein